MLLSQSSPQSPLYSPEVAEPAAAPRSNLRRAFDARNVGQVVLFLVPIAFSAWVYFPITSNYFFADDFFHMYRIHNETLMHFLLEGQGGHSLVTSNAVFYVLHRLFAINPQPYFWVVLVTHLLNVGLLFFAIRLLTQSARLACFGATLWGISPVHDGTIGWLSVYGQVIVASVLLCVVIQLAWVAAGHPLRRYVLASWCILLLAASTSFGVGIGLALALPVVGFLLLPASPARTRAVLVLSIMAVAVPVLYFGLNRLTTILYETPNLLPFMYSRSVGTNLEMLGQLIAYGTVSLLAGPLGHLLEYPSTLAWVILAVFGAAIVVTLLTAPWVVRRRLLAAIVLCVACYGMIAIGRSLFYETTADKYIFIRAPRYHHVGLILVAIAFCLMLGYLDRLYALRPALKNGLLVSLITLAAFAQYRSGEEINDHIAARRETFGVRMKIWQAINAAPPQQDVYIPNRPFMSMGPVYVTRQDLFPGWAGIFVVFFPSNVVAGRRVFFTVSDPNVLEAASKGQRSANLLVEAPAGT